MFKIIKEQKDIGWGISKFRAEVMEQDITDIVFATRRTDGTIYNLHCGANDAIVHIGMASQLQSFLNDQLPELKVGYRYDEEDGE